MKRMWSVALAAGLLGLSGASAQAATVAYEVVVNLSGITGVSGGMDFVLGGVGQSQPPFTVQVQNFVMTGGSLAGTSTPIGSGSGVLPGDLTMDTSDLTGTGGVSQNATFGTQMTFRLILDSPTINQGGIVPDRAVFGLFLYQGMTPLLTTDPNGTVFTINQGVGGELLVQTFPTSPTSGQEAATLREVPTQVIPEPGAIVLLGSGLAALAFWRRQRAA